MSNSFRPPRVLFLLENNPYPQDFRVRREAQTLRDAGYAVSVIAPRDKEEKWAEDVDRISVYRFPAAPGGSGVLSYAFEFGYATIAILLLALWVAIRRGVDVIHAGNPPDTLFAVGALFKLAGKRFVFDQHDLAPETYLSRFARPRTNAPYWVLRAIEWCSYCAADVVISPNESYKELAISRGGKAPSAVVVVRNGPPLSYVTVPPDQSVVSLAAYLIGYVGTIGPQDGLDYLVRAVAAMVGTFGRREFLVVVIGSGDALASVQSLASELAVDRYFLFTGRLAEADVRRYLSAVHVCVQPDPLSPLNDKSTMNKLMEYMALGKPTVAFDLKETRYSAQGAALYVRPNDELEFAKQVCWLLDHPDQRARMGEIGRSRVGAELAWEYSQSRLIATYDEFTKVPRSIEHQHSGEKP